MWNLRTTIPIEGSKEAACPRRPFHAAHDRRETPTVIVTMSQFCRELTAFIKTLSPEQKAEIRQATLAKCERWRRELLERLPPQTDLIQ